MKHAERQNVWSKDADRLRWVSSMWLWVFIVLAAIQTLLALFLAFDSNGDGFWAFLFGVSISAVLVVIGFAGWAVFQGFGAIVELRYFQVFGDQHIEPSVEE